MIGYSAEASGAIAAPMPASGALAGALLGPICAALLPGLAAEPDIHMLAAMGTLLAATFPIPLTATDLVRAITRCVTATPAVVASCVVASLAAQALGPVPMDEMLSRKLVSEQPRPGGLGTDPQREPTTTSPRKFE